MNSTRLIQKITDPTGRAAQLARGPWSESGIVGQLYLTVYNRWPTDEERAIAAKTFTAEGATRQSATEDLLWALVNSAEFVLNH